MSVAAGNKINNLLSRVATLEELFNSRPADVVDQRHRDELIWCHCHDAPFTFRADSLLALPKMLKDNCTLCLRSQSGSSLMITPKMKKRCSGFLKTCKRPLSTTRFVYYLKLSSVLMMATDGTTNCGSQPRTQINSECSSSVFGLAK